MYHISSVRKVIFYFLPVLVFALGGWVQSKTIDSFDTHQADDLSTHWNMVRASLDRQENADLSAYKTFIPLVQKPADAYYVSTTGNDSNPGTFAKPWRTIGKAARSAFPGMTVYIRGGVYNEVVDVTRSGTETLPIRFIAYMNETPIIDGNNQLPTYWIGLFSMHGDWIEVSGIETRNSKYDGFGLYGKHDTADNVSTHDNRYMGILIEADYGTVQNSRVWRNSLINASGSGGDVSTGITAQYDFENHMADYAVIRNNQVWQNFGEGISTYFANGTLIEGNTVYDNWSANIYVSDAVNILVQRNFVYSTGAMNGGSQVGIMMGDEKYTPPSSNITVLNNIVYSTRRNFFWWQGIQGGGMNNVLIANNTFVNSRYESGVTIAAGAHKNVRFYNNLTRQDNALPVILDEGDSPEVHYSNNLWSKKPPSSYPAGVPGDIIANPLLTENGGDPFSTKWFTLSGTSPAIDHALSLSQVPVDFFGNARGGAPDMGAVEYGVQVP